MEIISKMQPISSKFSPPADLPFGLFGGYKKSLKNLKNPKKI
jgi:hypothetical protein